MTRHRITSIDVDPDRVDPREPSSARALARAQWMYEARRARGKFFSAALFGEPTWDMLLDLFIHGELGKPISTSSLMIGAAVPHSTALRWIASMEETGLLTRQPDPEDGRRSFVALTREARDSMRAFLEGLP